MKDLIGTTEATQILGFATPSTLARWVQTGKITPVGRLGRRGAYVFERSQIEAFRDDPSLDERERATA